MPDDKEASAIGTQQPEVDVESLKRDSLEAIGCFDKGPETTPQWDRGYDSGAADMFDHLAAKYDFRLKGGK